MPHNQCANEVRPIMVQTRRGWFLMRADGTDHTENPTDNPDKHLVKPSDTPS